MSVTLRPYPEYKNSGLSWLGKIPEHWKVSRIKNVFRETEVRSGDGQGVLLSLTRTYGLLPQSEASNRLASAEDLSKYKVCKPGQLVMNRMQAWSGMFAVSSLDGLVSPDYSVFRSINAENTLYFLHLFKTPRYVEQFAQRSKGIGSGFNRLYTPDFGAIPIWIPPCEEQNVIVTFLAYFDRLINRLIRSKRWLIQLLNEQKQAIINWTVTRGLDPNVRLKPSGIDWLGDVPEHWEVRRAKAVCSAIIDCKNRTPEAHEDGAYTVVRTTCIRNGQFDSRGGYKTDEKNYLAWTARGAPRAGDVFFTREAPAGEACLVPERDDLCMGQRMMYFRPDRELLDAKFLLLNIYGPLTRTYVDLATNGSTVGHLRLGQVYALPILWCSLAEQRAIVKYVEEVTQEIDRTRFVAHREIELLREYQTRLITDVVTGKLDVRGVELPTLDETETLDSFDIDEDAKVENINEVEDADV